MIKTLNPQQTLQPQYGGHTLTTTHSCGHITPMWYKEEHYALRDAPGLRAFNCWPCRTAETLKELQK